jgi:hypothetical protein
LKKPSQKKGWQSGSSGKSSCLVQTPVPPKKKKKTKKPKRK